MAYTANHLKARLAARMRVHDVADATVATKGAWVPMGMNFLARIIVTAGAMVTFKIFAATDSSGTSPTEVAAHATPTQADAVGDMLVLEVSQEQVKAALAGATHVAVEIDMGSAADTAVYDYINDPRDKADGLTADFIS